MTRLALLLLAATTIAACDTPSQEPKNSENKANVARYGDTITAKPGDTFGQPAKAKP